MGKKRGWTLHPVGTQVDETPQKKRATVGRWMCPRRTSGCTATWLHTCGSG